MTTKSLPKECPATGVRSRRKFLQTATAMAAGMMTVPLTGLNRMLPCDDNPGAARPTRGGCSGRAVRRRRRPARDWTFDGIHREPAGD